MKAFKWILGAVCVFGLMGATAGDCGRVSALTRAAAHLGGGRTLCGWKTPSSSTIRCIKDGTRYECLVVDEVVQCAVVTSPEAEH